MNSILVIGSAGFIGANLVIRLLEDQEPIKIVGLDAMNNYYEPSPGHDFGFAPKITLRERWRELYNSITAKQ